MSERKDLGLSARELPAQDVVALLRGVNHLGVQPAQVVLHFSERRLGRARERRIQRRHHLDQPLHRPMDVLLRILQRVLD